MAFDEGLAQRIRDLLIGVAGVEEKRMFGGLCFTLHKHMFVGVVRNSLMARVGPANHAQALRRPGARPMDFTGKPMAGYVFVDPPGLGEDQDLAAWIEAARAFTQSLPPK